MTSQPSQPVMDEYLREIGLPGTGMLVEIAEGLLLADKPAIAEKLGQFHAMGIQIAIDGEVAYGS
ncbi:hypothetical protein [Methylomagnum ishizawai]|uniref:hypothetical protein n=1 Tax=Methylomagnum ishizawai TaxID=1760988 RepID=UPI000A16589E|nr:hypothetical protein [Methylomagnum ishizawai]